MTNRVIQNQFSKRDISGMLLLALLVSEYLPTYIAWVVFLLAGAVYVLKEKGLFRFHRMPGGIPLMVLILLGCIQGIIGYANGRTELWPFFRDIVYISYIFIYWFAADTIGRKMSYDMRSLYVTLFLFSGFSILIHILSGLPEFIRLVSMGRTSFSVLRMNEYMTAIGIYMCIFKSPEVGKCYFSTKLDFALKSVIIIGFILSFSRTALLLFVCLIGIKGIQCPIKFVRIVLAAIIVSAALYSIYPSLIENYFYKLAYSSTEVSFSAVSWNAWSINNNWRGYEVYCARQNFASNGLFEQLIGRGFGTGISVFGYEHLVTGESSLGMLHNGYYTTLLKGGVVGLTLNIVFLLELLINTWKHKNRSYDRLISFGSILGIVFSTAIISGPLWGGGSFEIMLLICWSIQNRSKKAIQTSTS